MFQFNWKKGIIFVQICFVVSLSFICSCTSTSQKSAKLAQQFMVNENYGAAFQQAYESLSADIKNKDAIKIFPDVYQKAVSQHLENINEAKTNKNWDTVSHEYDRLHDKNENASVIMDLIKENFEKELAEAPQKKGMFSKLTSSFSVPREDLDRIVNIKVQNISAEKDDAHQKASEQHYKKAQLLASENKYREASNEFNKSLSFVSNYKDATDMKEKYKKMADEEDAIKHYKEGQRLANEKKYRDASNEFDKALSFVRNFKDSSDLKAKYKKLADEEDAEKHYIEGKKLINEKKYRDASNEFSKSLSFVSGYKDSQSLKEKYKKMADEQDAEKHYQEGKRLMQQKKYTLAYDEFVKSNEYVYSYKDVLQLIDESKNKMPPSENEIINAVERCLSRDGVPVSWVGNLMGGGKTTINSISVIRVGIFNESQNYWPMIIRVQGSSLLNDPFNKGKRVSFDKNGDFRLYRDDYGDWQATLKGGMFQ
jgi:tetratricopeptide (TPR) repeat protein